jgi:hypothetical protein
MDGSVEDVGCTEIILEVGTRVVLSTFGVDVGAGTDVPMVGETGGGVVGRGALLELATVSRVVGTA